MLEERSIAPFVDMDASVIEAPGSPMTSGLHNLTPVPFPWVPPPFVVLTNQLHQ